MGFFSRIGIWLRSEADAVPLALVLLVSPLTPLATLRQLRELGEYSYLPDPEELLVREPDALGEKMREVLRAALLAQRAGRRSVLEQELDELMARTGMELEVADYHLSQLFQLASLFTTVIPVTLASVVLFTNPGAVAPLLLACAAAAAILGAVAGLGVFPRELALPTPPLKSFTAMVLLPLTYLALVALGMVGVGIECPVLLSTALGSIPLSLTQLSWRQRVLATYREARELVRKAGTASYNVFAALGIKDPAYLLSGRWVGVARAAATSLYMLCLYGGRGLEAALRRLEAYVGRYLDYLLRIRGKTRAMLLYGLLEAAVVAASYAILMATLRYLSSLPGGAVGVRIPSQAELDAMMEWLDAVLAVDSLALALATAAAREGQPLLFGSYLPALAAVTWAGFTLGLHAAPLLFS
ncbi:MAG: hypothetical protein J7L75_00535 [Thermoproteales archaeon]|nr:hypothetical protein [Thermoproteales archaeon]